MQGLWHVRENTQPVALLSSPSVTPYNPPFKEMSSFMAPSTHSKSTPLRSVQLKHTTKPQERYRTSFFSQAVPPSSPQIVCLSFGEKKPTCVSCFELTWLPVPHCAGQRQPQSRPSKATGYLVFGVPPPSWELPGGEALTKCHLCRQTDRKSKKQRPSFSLRWGVQEGGSLWLPCGSPCHLPR